MYRIIGLVTKTLGQGLLVIAVSSQALSLGQGDLGLGLTWTASLTEIDKIQNISFLRRTFRRLFYLEISSFSTIPISKLSNCDIVSTSLISTVTKLNCH